MGEKVHVDVLLLLRVTALTPQCLQQPYTQQLVHWESIPLNSVHTVLYEDFPKMKEADHT